jgi:NADPH:quinone reductase-like Zn-dependent oxidoreductase
MRAVVIRRHGGLEALNLEEAPDPRPGPTEALVEVRACGVNHLDLWVRRGVPGHTFPLPIIPGCDVAGVVREVGEAVRGVDPGTEVVALPGIGCGACRACSLGNDHLCRDYGILGETRDGGYAPLVVLPGVNLLPLPAGLGFERAAAFPLAFLTAWHMLVARAELRPGDAVLVHAAGSGVGSAAVQIARLLGARVIATAGSDAKLARARELGADETINYRTADFAHEVARLTGKRGVDVVVEHVGEATWEGSLRCLAKGGRLVTCGATSGPRGEVHLPRLFFKSLSILGSTMGSRGELHRIVQLVGEGKLRPVVDRVLPLSEVREAHRVLEDREQFGKVVLRPARLQRGRRTACRRLPWQGAPRPPAPPGVPAAVHRKRQPGGAVVPPTAPAPRRNPFDHREFHLPAAPTRGWHERCLRDGRNGGRYSS